MKFYKERILYAAKQYIKEGYSIIPCNGKKPQLKSWQEYTVKKPRMNEIESWFGELASDNQSIGLVCGAISNNLVVVDLDGIPAIKKFASSFPNLCELTESVLTGSQEGIHFYFHVDQIPNNLNVRVSGVGGFELRGNGQYVIAPPSIHSSGYEYRVYRQRKIIELDNLNNVYDWMQSLRESEQESRQAEIAESAKDVSVNVSSKRKENFLKKVLSEEIARVATASEGNRNNSLFYAALRLANYAAGKELDWNDCKSALLLATDLKFSEAYRTVESAYRIGSKYPKVVK